jgi:endonuclease-3
MAARSVKLEQAVAATVSPPPPSPSAKRPPPRTGLEHAAAHARSPKLPKVEAIVPAARPSVDASPFPHLARPTPEECQVSLAVLRRLYGTEDAAPPTAAHGSRGQYSVLDQLVATILSQNTTDTTSWKAFLNLKALFPTWDAVRLAPVGDVAASIKSAGLSAVKSARIQAILATLHSERGKCCLEYLHSLGDAEAKAVLSTFKGMGPKSISCVLMFALHRHEFPVDTHVWKLAKALSWVPETASREQTYAHLNVRVPGPLRHELHVLLVEHGKKTKNSPRELAAALSEARRAA